MTLHVYVSTSKCRVSGAAPPASAASVVAQLVLRRVLGAC